MTRQRAALDDLANASVKAAQDIKAACPKRCRSRPRSSCRHATADRGDDRWGPDGSAALQKFYDFLNDEQRLS
jgi:hypothetical protein